MRKHLVFYVIILACSAGCVKKEFPTPTSSKAVFDLSGTLDGDSIHLTPGVDDLYLYTWVESITEDLYKINCEISQANCEECGEAFGMSWYSNSPTYEDLTSSLSNQQAAFFPSNFTDSIEIFTADLFGLDGFFTWEFNDEVYDASEDHFSLTFEEALLGFNIGVNSFPLGNCFGSLYYEGVWIDPCNPVLDLPKIDWSYTDSQTVVFYPPTEFPADALIFWSTDFGEYLLPANEPFETELNGVMGANVVMTPLFDTQFNSVFVSIPTSQTCPSFGFNLTAIPQITTPSVTFYYRNEGTYYSSYGNCVVPWLTGYTQPEWAAFEVTNLEEYHENEDGLKTVKFDFNLNCEMLDELSLIPKPLELSGTLALPLPF